MRTIFRRFLYRFSVVAIASLACGTSAPLVSAGVVTGPTATDTFPSTFREFFFLQPAYTGLGNEVLVETTGASLPGTAVLRELNAFSGFYGTDTIDTEFQSMHLAGSVVNTPGFNGTPVQFQVGQGNGFLPGLTYSPGQVAEKPTVFPNPPTPINGQLDLFPAKSVFDLFIDVWVDLNTDNIVDNGEVLRNFDQSLRMNNDNLTGFPPENDRYIGLGWVSRLDPLLGEFGATVFTSRLDFYIVNLDGTNSGIVAAQIDFDYAPVHEIPEPSSLAIFGGLTLLAGRRRLQGLRKRLFGR
jgi:hypothetical protein